MTRREALERAMEALKSSDGNADAINKLKGLYDEIPAYHWTEEAALDAIEMWAQEHKGQLPSHKKLLGSNNLPCKRTIQRLFHITSIGDFYKKYFPEYQRAEINTSPYKNEKNGYYFHTFKTTYKKIQKMTGEKIVIFKHYDRYRDNNTTCLNTIIRNCHVKNYKELLLLAGFIKPQTPVKVTSVSITYNDQDDFSDIKKIIKKIG